jgi:hypothetical protein
MQYKLYSFLFALVVVVVVVVIDQGLFFFVMVRAHVNVTRN